jgi:aminoglycoside phosphotransferase family enzyme/predicted kinase
VTAAGDPLLDAQARHVAAFERRLAARGTAVQRIETHASWVLIAGADAYKIKKAVDLGFLDFRTLAQRRFYCDEELRLNRRTAPRLYLGVLPLAAPADGPELGGAGEPIDWVLHMRAFDQAGLWDRLAARGALGEQPVDDLVAALVRLHAGAAVAAPDDPRGRAASVRAPLLDSLAALDALCTSAAERAEVQALRAWEAGAFAALEPSFDRRLRDGFVRECHGDLHLGNVAQVGGEATMFDCLEFSDALRFTDVMSDVAFMAMDLHAHDLPRLAHRFVNAYVEGAGDEGGLAVLRYYVVHRALVRAKVAGLRARQMGHHAGAMALTRRHYLDVALAASRPAPPVLLLTHGLPGSGKTLLTQSLLELAGAVRVRADVQRKRLFGLAALARSDAAAKERLYGEQANADTQARLREAAALALGAGCPVILDATFADAADRDAACALAGRLHAPCLILDFDARPETLRARVRERERRGDDPSEAGEAVLQAQLARWQPLRADEAPRTVVVDAEAPFDSQRADERWAPLLARLRRGGAAAVAAG